MLLFATLSRPRAPLPPPSVEHERFLARIRKYTISCAKSYEQLRTSYEKLQEVTTQLEKLAKK